MISVLALDLATKTGWAFGEMDAEPEYGTLELPGGSKNLGPFLHTFSNWLDAALHKMIPEYIVYELPVLPKTTNPTTVIKLNSLAGHTELLAHLSKIHCRGARNSTVMKHFTGNGGGKRDDRKARCINACLNRGWEPEDDNQADALAIWDYTMFCLNPDTSHTIALNGMGAAA